MKRSLLLLAVLAACHGGSRPKFDDKLMSPAAKGLKVGVATLDDVTKAFPTAQVDKDKSLGGDKIVEYGDKKAIAVDGDGVEASIVDGKLVSIYVHGPGLYDWLVSTMDGMAGATDCPGNRKMGKDGHEAAYCASAGDQVVFIEADKGEGRDELNYHLMQ
jgi:hypothetical protein